MAIPYTPTWTSPYAAATPQQTLSPVPVVQPPTIAPVNGIIKVSNRQSAEAYAMPPNSTSPALFDANGKTFYIKTTDGAGIGTVEAFDFQEHVEPVAAIAIPEVTRDEFDKLSKKVDAILERQQDVEVPKPVHAASAAATGRAVGNSVDDSVDVGGKSLGSRQEPSSN